MMIFGCTFEGRGSQDRGINYGNSPTGRLKSYKVQIDSQSDSSSSVESSSSYINQAIFQRSSVGPVRSFGDTVDLTIRATHRELILPLDSMRTFRWRRLTAKMTGEVGDIKGFGDFLKRGSAYLALEITF